MLCLSCNHNEARQSQFGVLPCQECTDRMRSKTHKTRPFEFTTDSIREERRRFAKDIIQPFRAGELSKEYVDTWGANRLNVTPEEVKKAKNVWSGDLTYYE